MGPVPTRALLASGASRIGVFFAASVLIATVLGAALGDVRQGITTGVSVGFLTAAFALLFVRPAEPEDGADADADTGTDAGERPDGADPDG